MSIYAANSFQNIYAEGVGAPYTESNSKRRNFQRRQLKPTTLSYEDVSQYQQTTSQVNNEILMINENNYGKSNSDSDSADDDMRFENGLGLSVTNMQKPSNGITPR